MITIKFNNGTNVNCKFRRKTEHIIHLVGTIPQNTSGFKAYDNEVLLGDYSDYTTIYRTLEDGVQFSNDGSIWVEPTKEVTLKVNWYDDQASDRPMSVNVTHTLGTITINASDNWQKTISILESQSTEIISSTDLNNYTKVISGHDVFYTLINTQPSWKEKVDAQLTYTAMMTDTLIEEQ